MSDKYQDLRDALKAGPSNWTPDKYGNLRDERNESIRVNGVSLPCGHVPSSDPSHKNTAYITAASPATITALLADLDAERLECMAQAKLNGIGAERELALMAERDALKADLDAAVGALEMMADYTADQGHLMQGLASSTLSQIKAGGV
jgi:hypothetical protein